MTDLPGPPSWQPPTGGPVPPPPPPPYGSTPTGPPAYGSYGQPSYGTPGYGSPIYQQPYGGQQPYAVQAPKPGIIPLRPLAVGEILDGAFATIRRHPRAVLGLSAGVACLQEGAILLVRAAAGSLTTARSITYTDTNGESQTHVGAVYSVYGGSLLVTTLIGALLTGMLCLIVSDSVLGQPTSLGSAWTRLRPSAGRLVVVSVLATMGEVFGLALFVVPGSFLWGIWALVVPALVLERTTVRGAFSRSWQLVRTSFWRVWGIRALGALIAGVLNGVVTLISGASLLHDIFSGSTTGVIHISAFTIVLSAVLGVLASTLTAPFLCGVVTLLYVDRRIRAEALDVQLQQAAAAAPTTG